MQKTHDMARHEQDRDKHVDNFATQFIFLIGNLDSGYRAYGPYNSFDEACEAHDYQEGWVMHLDKKQKETTSSVTE
jgi:hypothetical protein